MLACVCCVKPTLTIVTAVAWFRGRDKLDVSLSNLTPERFEEALDSRFFAFFSLASIIGGAGSVLFLLFTWAEHVSSRFIFIFTIIFFCCQIGTFLLWLFDVVSRRTSGLLFAVANAALTVFGAAVSASPFMMVWRGQITCFWAAFLATAANLWVGWLFLVVMTCTSLFVPPSAAPWVDVQDVIGQNDMLPLIECCFVLLLLSQLVRDNRLRKAKIRDTFVQLATQKDAFVATISHEIRTPLHGISGSVEMLKTEPGLTPASRQLVEAISHCASALQLLIENVLGLGGTSVKDSAPARLATDQLLDRVRNYSTALALSKPGLKLSIEAKNVLPRTLEVRETAALQILLNLISNAIKFSPAGSHEVAVLFDVERGERDNTLVAEVIDEGVGVRPEFRNKLFLPYSRDVGHASGTGLGLMISQKVAEQAGGSVGYRPRPDKEGSIFYMRLPVVVVQEQEKEEARAPTPRRQPERSAKKKRVPRVEAQQPQPQPQPPRAAQAAAIAVEATASAAEQTDVLVVEDNLVNQRVIVQMLKRAGVVPVGVFGDGASALQYLLETSKREEQKRTVVLLDNTMPIMTGIRMAELWRHFEQAINAPIRAKICLVTASNVAKTLHVDQVILKPLTMDALKSAITIE